MRTIYFILALLFLSSCKREEDNHIANVNCDKGILTQNQLYLAAAKLEIHDPSNPDKDNPYLSTSRVDEKYQAFKAIESLNNPYTDSVFNKYGIPYGYYFGGDAQFITISNVEDPDLKNSIINSTVRREPLRSIYEKYNLQLHSERMVYGNHEIVLKTCELTNVVAVAKEIRNTASLSAKPTMNTFVYSRRLYHDRYQVSVSINPVTNTTEYNFIIGCGFPNSSYSYDGWRHWVFSVDKNGVAAFVKSYGAPAPPF